MRYNPALDGIRALAVLAVLGVHELPWLPGGFYGVDAFFVLSGYLITSLLLTEWAGTGGVALGRFWARRGRRLLPALFVLVAAVGVVAAITPTVLGAPHLLADGVATLFYSANWYQVAAHVGYFDAVAQPSPLLHTWSLAIEEQFYLVWPLVVVLVLRGARRTAAGTRGLDADFRETRAERTARRQWQRRLELLLGVAAVGALASAAWMADLSPFGAQMSNRAYYGTDTRMQGLLVGAALAAAFARWGPATGRGARRFFGVAAVAGVAGTAALWWFVSPSSGLAFHGGFLLAALATAAVLAGVVQVPGGIAFRALAVRPLRALGRISYGVYLWYWPVLLVVNGSRTHLSTVPLFALRLTVTVVIATASYYLVERPIRRGALPSWRALVAAPVGIAAGVAAMLVASLVPASGVAAPSEATSAAKSAGHAAEVAATAAASKGATAHPLRVLLVGDSLAGSLGTGLSVEAARYGVQLINEGAPGCSVAMDQQVKVLWYTIGPGAPCRPGDPQALLNQWRRWVDAYNPDVVLYLARGELFDQEVGGQWTNLGAPSFDHYLLSRFEAATQVLGSRGAAVVLLTTPVNNSGEQGSGAPWPEDDPHRVTIDNALIRQAVAAASARLRHASAAPTPAPGVPPGPVSAPTPGPVSAFDLAGLFTPGDRYQSSVSGVTDRCTDGVHFTLAAGEWLAPRLLPEVVALGSAHRTASPSGAWPGAEPPAIPAWWSRLPCG